MDDWSINWICIRAWILLCMCLDCHPFEAEMTRDYFFFFWCWPKLNVAEKIICFASGAKANQSRNHLWSEASKSLERSILRIIPDMFLNSTRRLKKKFQTWVEGSRRWTNPREQAAFQRADVMPKVSMFDGYPTDLRRLRENQGNRNIFLCNRLGFSVILQSERYTHVVAARNPLNVGMTAKANPIPVTTNPKMVAPSDLSNHRSIIKC